MKKVTILCLLTVGIFLNIQGTVLFEQPGKPGKVSYEGLIKQANAGDKNALTALANAWDKDGDATKNNYIGDYLAKQGYSANDIDAKKAALENATPSVPAKPSVEPGSPSAPPIIPAAPSAPSAPPMAPGAPNAPATGPAVKPGDIANLTDQQRNKYEKEINELLLTQEEGSTNASNLKDYLKKLKAKTLKNRERDSLEDIFTNLKAEKEKEAELQKQQEELEEQFKKEAVHIEEKIKERVRDRIKNKGLKNKLENEFSNHSNGKDIVKTATLILSFDEIQQEIDSIKDRSKAINKEPEIKDIANELNAQSDKLSANKSEIAKLQASLTDPSLDPDNILEAVQNIRKLTTENSKLTGTIEALNNQKAPIVKLIQANLDNKIKLLSKLIESKIQELQKSAISKDDGNKLLKILDIEDKIDNQLVAIIKTKKNKGVIITPEELERMKHGHGGAINKPSSPTGAKHPVLSPLEKQLNELITSIDSFDRKRYADEPYVKKARNIYDAIKNNTKKRNEDDRLRLVNALNKDLSILNKGDTEYKKQVARSKTDKSPSIFIEFEETKAFL